MSLDLYIESKTPITHRGTGVYVRENGETKELQTKEEVLRHFPDVNPDEIEVREYEDNTYFHLNLTHNLNKMAAKCEPVTYASNGVPYSMRHNLYKVLWRPGEIGIITPTMSYVDNVIQCYKRLMEEPDFFKQYNPENGWGTYEQLLEGTRKYVGALMDIIGKLEDYTIVADI